MSGTPNAQKVIASPVDLTPLVLVGQQTNILLSEIWTTLGKIPSVLPVLPEGEIFVGNTAGAAATVAMSGDVEINAGGTTTVESIGGEAVSLGGPLTTGGTVDFSGAHAVTLVSTGATDITLPTTGALQTTALPSADIWVGNSGGVAQARAMSGDAEISNTGAVTVVSAGGVSFGALAFENSVTYAEMPASADIATVPFSLIGTPASGQIFPITVTQAGTLLANGGTPQAYIGTDPTSTAYLTIETIHSGTVVTQGTVTISTAGSVTWPTFSAVSMAAGDTAAIVN
jgi:hypothetical protein